MKKFLSVFITLLLCLSVTACSGSSGKADEALVGKYICVTGTMLGVNMSGDEVSDFEIELQSKGKATMKIMGESHKIKWSNDDSTITLKIDGAEAVGELGEDVLTFKDFLKDEVGVSMDLTFAKEGSEAAEPENYLPEEEQALIGEWVSVSVTDILGEDVSSEVDPGALTATFDGEHSATISFKGEEVGSSKWSLYSEMILFNDEFGDGLSISGDYKDGVLTISYNDDNADVYYIFTMSNADGS